ncbi:MAG: hypothetical protein QN157_09975 [Armatimonadota bacterium]|nr:hypothetical protein [Armatimonadota bacterium]
MTDRPFEVIAEIALQGLPTSGDIARVGEEVERARQATPAVVRATVVPPARFRDGTYCLETRCAVWAADGAAAVAAVERLLRGAGLTTRTVHLSGRALTAADVPPPPAQPQTTTGGSGSSRPAPARRRGARAANAAGKAAPAARRRGGAGASRGAASKGKASSSRRGR